MIHEVFVEQGRKIKIERRMAARCLMCGVEISCPDGEDFWAWLKRGDVQEFLLAHRPHGPAGVNIETVEVE